MAAGARTMVDIPIPSEVSTVAIERGENCRDGNYRSALSKQKELERLKQEEDDKQMAALVEKQEMELAELDQKNVDEYNGFLMDKEGELSMMLQQHSKLQQSTERRHSEEQQTFMKVANEAVPKMKWSSELLNQRKIEEHLIRQRDWARAEKVKANADGMEVRERAASVEAWRIKCGLEEAKMLQRQSKEASGLNAKLASAQTEFALIHNRELEQRQRKWNAARTQLMHTHALERQQLEQAMKSWYNPRKTELYPVPLSPTKQICLMAPGEKLVARRHEGTISRSTASSPYRTTRITAPSNPPSPDVAAPAGAAGSDARSASEAGNGSSEEATLALKPECSAEGRSVEAAEAAAVEDAAEAGPSSGTIETEGGADKAGESGTAGGDAAEDSKAEGEASGESGTLGDEGAMDNNAGENSSPEAAPANETAGTNAEEDEKSNAAGQAPAEATREEVAEAGKKVEEAGEKILEAESGRAKETDADANNATGKGEAGPVSEGMLAASSPYVHPALRPKSRK